MAIFATRMTVSFILQFWSITVLQSNDDKIQSANFVIKDANLLLYMLELLALIYLISLDQRRFTVFLKRLLCNRNIKAIDHLQRQMSDIQRNSLKNTQDFTLEMGMP